MGSYSIFFSLLFFFVDDDDDFVDVDDDDGLAVLVVGVLLESILAVGVIFGLFETVAGSLMGVFFFFPPFTTWVQPSSLLGLSPVLSFEVSLGSATVAASAAAIVVVVFAIGGVVVGVVLVVFWGQDFEKCPSCLQIQHWGFLPSTTTVIALSSYDIVCGMAVKPPLSKHMVKT